VRGVFRGVGGGVAKCEEFSGGWEGCGCKVMDNV
jgi:hypothetical protein